MMYLTNEHLDAPFEEKEPPPPLIHPINGDDGGQHVDPARDHCRHQRRITAKADGLEQDRGVKHDDIDAGELLEEGDGDGHSQLRSILPLEEVPPGVFDLA